MSRLVDSTQTPVKATPVEFCGTLGRRWKIWHFLLSMCVPWFVYLRCHAYILKEWVAGVIAQKYQICHWKQTVSKLFDNCKSVLSTTANLFVQLSNLPYFENDQRYLICHESKESSNCMNRPELSLKRIYSCVPNKHAGTLILFFFFWWDTFIGYRHVY
jgi:hypothetical protein